MRCRQVKRLPLFLALLSATAPFVRARTSLELVGAEIPKRLYIGAERIFFESDSLYLNSRLLVRNIDYSFEESRRSFDLSRLDINDTDTLSVTYHKVPAWLPTSYGRSLPAASSGTVARPTPSSAGRVVNPFSESSGISISGAKSFRFSSRSSGSSDFSQSLDLRVSGALTPGLEVSGSVSDRGYDPSYGPSNSRLSELERINLTLKSDVLAAQVGDMSLVSRFDAAPGRDKRVSGAALNLHSQRWYAEAMVARPKGRFETFSFTGVDGLQGPYQIGEGANVRPVVPGSEQVWLDGQLLERGAHKDYSIDYPTGRITFSVKHPIDRRSRIEIDYEPRSTEYRGELLSSGGGVTLGDSAVSLELEWLREGDDRDQPLTGGLSESDKDLLASIGDSVSAAVRSGVAVDSNGSYVLVGDSLPDSVYQYVGAGKGECSISFSFVGTAKGAYRFLGGDRYEFVGPGKGDYLPIIIIPAPERTDYYNTRLSVHNAVIGELTAELRQTLFDQNLFSSRDDRDNGGLFYSVMSAKQWRWNGQTNRLVIKGRRKEANFKARDRLYRADFKREFLLPGDFVPVADEMLYEVSPSISPSRFFTLSPSFSRLNYKNRFESSLGGVKASLFLHRNIDAHLGWQSAQATYDSLAMARKGAADTYNMDITYRVSRRLELLSSYEYDSRKNEYSGEPRGTRYNRYRWLLDARSERLSYEYYVEDSLMSQWDKILSRSRIQVSSDRQLGLLTYSADLAYQWITQPDYASENFLGQMHLRYNDFRRRLDMNASYTLSDETRNARGISYLEVERGQGEYSFENGQYIPDPDGNYIRVEEILSDRSRVSRGEKSFHLSKDFSAMLVSFNSTIQEELLKEGTRKFWWAVPFLSDETQPYLFYFRQYNADVRLFPIKNAHAVNITLNDDREMRDVAGEAKTRHDTKGSLALKQVVKNTRLEENVELFRSDRDSYFSGGGKIDGYKVGVNIGQLLAGYEISTGGSFRRAESSLKERSEIYSLQSVTRVQVVKKGELRTSLELYRQVLSNMLDLPSFLLTDSKSGSRGAIWSVSLRYGLKEGFRMNFTVTGRHSDDRTARITAHGEMVAGF
jgi:hypothetical protein